MERSRFPPLVAAVAVVAILFPLLSLQRTFVLNDYREQHLPWAYEMDRRLAEHASLPLWTTGFQSGYPLFAEGQVGGFHPPHLLLYALLPFRWAYPLNVLLHWGIAIAGMAWLCRTLGLGPWGTATGTLLFTFGSGFAGFFYSIAWHVLVWLPWACGFLERRLRGGGGWTLAAAALALGWMVLGGYLQFALYAWIATAVFTLIRLDPAVGGRGMAWTLAGVAVAFLGGAIVASPQIVASLELAARSVRAGTDANFAMQGSALPLVLANLIYPTWKTFLGEGAYVGVLPLVLIAYRLRHGRDRFLVGCAIAAGLFTLASFGKFFPPNRWIVEGLGLTFLRFPEKLLFFTAFFLALAAAASADRLLGGIRHGGLPRPGRAVRWGILAALLLPLVTHGMLRLLEKPILDAGRRYVARSIVGKPGHPHSPETYEAKLVGRYRAGIESTNPAHPYVAASVGLLAVAGLGLWTIARRGTLPRFAPHGFLLLLAGDLVLYSLHGTGYRGNLGPPERLAPRSALAERIRTEGLPGRTASPVFDEMRTGTDPHPLVANHNLMHRIPAVGIYTPLAMKGYAALVEGLGILNDSTAPRSGSEEALADRLPLLALLHVRYIVLHDPVRTERLRDALEPMGTYDGFHLYRHDGLLPRAVWFPAPSVRYASPEAIRERMRSADYTPRREIYIEGRGPVPDAGHRPKAEAIPLSVREVSPTELLVEIEPRGEPGWVRVADLAYPGWTVEVDGASAEVLTADGVLRAVAVHSGARTVRFRYRPVPLLALLVLSAVVQLGLAVLLIRAGRQGRRGRAAPDA